MKSTNSLANIFNLVPTLTPFTAHHYHSQQVALYDVSDSSKLLAKKRANYSINSYFSFVFDSFSPFYAQERISPVDLYKRATMSYSLRTLMTKDKRVAGAIRSFSRVIALLLFRSQKTSESLEKLMSYSNFQVPTLALLYLNPILHYYFRHCVRRQDLSHFVSPLFLTLILVDIFRTTIKGRQIFLKPITVWRISSEYKMCCTILTVQ